MGFGAGEIACKLEVITEDGSSASGAVVANCDARSARTQEQSQGCRRVKVDGIGDGAKGQSGSGRRAKKRKKKEKKRTLAETMYL